jgi:GNAT superfamily N-acetyltransferase
MDALLSRIEAMGVRGREQYWSRMPPDLARRVRPRTAHVGDAFVTLMEKSDSLRVNRVIGMGHRGEAAPAMIDEIIELFRRARVARFSFELSPCRQADAIERWLTDRGFVRTSGYSLLIRDLGEPVARAPSGVRVVRAGRAHYDTVTRIFGETFAIPVTRRGWSRSAVAAADSEHFVALIGSKPVGAAALSRDGDIAWLGGGATLTRWRRKGAHAALIAARLRRAAHHGCRWAWSETTVPAPGRPSGSRRNLIRFGFRELCLKPAFVWRED